MDCIEVRSRLASRRDSTTRDETMQRHLEQCKACHSYATDVKLARLLSSMPVPAPSGSFQARIDATVAGAATPAHGPQHRRRLPLALAATVLIAFGAGIMTAVLRPVPVADHSSGPSLTLRVQPGKTRVVDVSVNSPRRLENATITLTLDRNIVLDGHPSVHKLRWQTAIAAGENRISLPLALRQPGNGSVTIVITAHGMRRSLTLALSSRPQSPETI